MPISMGGVCCVKWFDYKEIPKPMEAVHDSSLILFCLRKFGLPCTFSSEGHVLHGWTERALIGASLDRSDLSSNSPSPGVMLNIRWD
jgi:hypothetical protein